MASSEDESRGSGGGGAGGGTGGGSGHLGSGSQKVNKKAKVIQEKENRKGTKVNIHSFKHSFSLYEWIFFILLLSFVLVFSLKSVFFSKN